MKRGIICQKCGVEAPAKYVEFYYNIGCLVRRYHKAVKGNLCKRCIHKTFWNYTLTDVTLGWWGTISLVVTPVFLVNNIVRYVGAITLAPTPGNASPPKLTPDAASRLDKHRKELIDRINKKEVFVDVAESVARLAGVTPGQVVLYVRALSAPRRAAPPAPARGFEVVPVAGQASPAAMAAIPLEPAIDLDESADTGPL